MKRVFVWEIEKHTLLKIVVIWKIENGTILKIVVVWEIEKSTLLKRVAIWEIEKSKFSLFDKPKEYCFENSSGLIALKSTVLKRVLYVYQVS